MCKYVGISFLYLFQFDKLLWILMDVYILYITHNCFKIYIASIAVGSFSVILPLTLYRTCLTRADISLSF